MCGSLPHVPLGKKEQRKMRPAMAFSSETLQKYRNLPHENRMGTCGYVTEQRKGGKRICTMAKHHVGRHFDPPPPFTKRETYWSVKLHAKMHPDE